MFPSNANSASKGELKLNPYVNLIANAGIDYFVSKNFQLALEVYYNHSLFNISDNNSPDKFHLSSNVNQINSLMGGSNNVSLQSFGVLISLRYNLKSPI